MINYFKNLDNKVQDTLNVYNELGKLSIPFFKYLLIIISFIVVTSCISIFISFFNNGINNEVWVYYSLPIIIYGVTTPILSTVITTIVKIFIDTQINNIKERKLYLSKVSNKEVSLKNDLYNIIKCIFFSRNIFVILSSFLCLLLPLSYSTILLIIIIIIVSNILIKISQYYSSSVNFNIVEVEKCNDNKETYWRYCIEIDYPNQEKRIIKKRFNDFKELHNKLNVQDTLPTSNWNFTPNNIKEASSRGNELNLYFKNHLENKTTLNNSTFFSFIKDTKNEKNTIIEKNTIGDKSKNNKNNILENKSNKLVDLNESLFKLINEPVNDIFILYDINYYTMLKKRYFILNDKYLYKIRYDNNKKKFFLRKKIDIKSIFNIKKSIIINTTYLKNRDILIINYIENLENITIFLTSYDQQICEYSINCIYLLLKEKVSSGVNIEITNGYSLNIGYGLTEELFNNSYVTSMKSSLKNIFY